MWPVINNQRSRQAKNKELETDAEIIRWRAENRLGELIKAQKETVGLNQDAIPGKTGSKGEPLLDPRPTLANAGIGKKLSSRAQAVAARHFARSELAPSSRLSCEPIAVRYYPLCSRGFLTNDFR
jgi:hypothetical protein